MMINYFSSNDDSSTDNDDNDNNTNSDNTIKTMIANSLHNDPDFVWLPIATVCLSQNYSK